MGSTDDAGGNALVETTGDREGSLVDEPAVWSDDSDGRDERRPPRMVACCAPAVRSPVEGDLEDEAEKEEAIDSLVAIEVEGGNALGESGA